MYCPNDGIELQAQTVMPDPDHQVKYQMCQTCRVTWMQKGNEYYPLLLAEQAEAPDISDLLNESGQGRRNLGIDALVGNIVEAMEKKAEDAEDATYYLGTFAVAPCTIVHAGLTCTRRSDSLGLPFDLKFQWTSFFGDDWEEISREEAIKTLLAERS